MKNNFPGKPRIGISAVLGWKVRYDGSDRKDAFLAETIASHIAWVPVCPEVEVGMGVPRRPYGWWDKPGLRGCLRKVPERTGRLR
jgi:uncharacterized protein YbbK (DUF523 family)